MVDSLERYSAIAARRRSGEERTSGYNEGLSTEVTGDHFKRHPGRLGREESGPQQFKEAGFAALGNAVQAKYQNLGKPGEKLEEGNPRVRRVVVSPLRRIARDERPGLRCQVGKSAVIQVG